MAGLRGTDVREYQRSRLFGRCVMFRVYEAIRRIVGQSGTGRWSAGYLPFV